MRTVAILAVVTGLARAGCLAVPSGRILARDLAVAVPLFQAVNPDEILGFAPFPGTKRVLSSRELLLTARRYGLVFPPGEPAPSVCIERIVSQLSLEQVRAALLASLLDMAGVQLEVLTFSSQPLPPGQLAFRREALNTPPGNNPQTPVIWRGNLVYDDQHSLSVWARVRISVEREIPIAVETIQKGAVIRADQVATTYIRQFPSVEPSPALPRVIAGKVARSTLPAGQPIFAAQLDELKDVFRGETVHVRVIDGGASICFDGIAQSSGQKGDTIMIYNRSSAISFRALIEGRQQVLVRGTP